MPRARRRAVGWALSVAVLSSGTLAGCTDDTGDAPAAPPASTGAPDASPGEGAYGRSEPSEPAEPDLEPADGIQLEHDSTTLRAPEGWREGPSLASSQLSAEGPGSELIVFIEQVALDDTSSIDETARRSLKGYRSDGVRRLDDVEVAGVTFYHLGGWSPTFPDERFDMFGTIHDGRWVTIRFTLERDRSLRRDPDLIESVLASFEWKG